MKSAYYSRAGSYSRSHNAHVAESEGRMPATRAAKEWGFKSAAALRQWVSTSEWHHVGKFANCVDYFDVDGWIEDTLIPYNYCNDGGVFAEIAGISNSLTKDGRSRTLAAIVRRCVAANLEGTPSYRRMNRKPRYQRQAELAQRHGIGFAKATGTELSDAGAVIFAANAAAAAKALLRQKTRAAFPAQLKANLSWHSPALPQNDRDSRWKARFDQLVKLFGNPHHSKAIRRMMHINKQNLTLANYRATFTATSIES